MKSDSTAASTAKTSSTQLKSLLRQRHNAKERIQQQNDQTAAERQSDNMFYNSYVEHDNYQQNSMHSRLSHFQQQQNNSFDTYPSKRNSKKQLQQQQQKKISSSASNILQTTTTATTKRVMPSRNSPLKNTNTAKFYTKRSAKKSFSETSVEKLQKYTISDSSSTQEDELMMSTADKRKMTRRSLSGGLQQHKYYTSYSQREAHSIGDDEKERIQQQNDQTAAERQSDSMFYNSYVEHDNYQQNSMHSRLSHFQQQQNNSFDTYPSKRNSKKQLQQQQQKKISSSASNILQTTTTATTKRVMPSRNSPLKNTNTAKFYTKRSAKKSFSETSVEKLQKYTISDSSSTQEDELMMSTADKRKMTRRSLSGGLQQHKYYTSYSQREAHSIGDDDYDVARCTTIFGKRSEQVSDMIDIGIRMLLVVVFSQLETQTAFQRIIHSEEMWMYKNPRTKDYVSPLALILSVIFGPFLVTLINLALTKDRRDFRAASWAWTLILGLNGLATSLLKITVGRPRPDYFYRCFPDGVMQLNQNGSEVDNMLELFNCTGNIRDINEGRKSFPSGHSSFAFAGFGFITYYVSAKLHSFNHRGRGESWRFCVSIAPLVLATLVAVSRTCDYHHHWEDVAFGSVIGLFVSYYIYRQYYPSIFSAHCHRPYPRSIYQSIKITPEPLTTQSRNRRRLHSYKRVPSEECGTASLLCEDQSEELSASTDKRPLIKEQKSENKWF